jgi:hypothetical protein
LKSPGPGQTIGTAKRPYITLAIPESAILRVCARFKAQPIIQLPPRKLKKIH